MKPSERIAQLCRDVTDARIEDLKRAQSDDPTYAFLGKLINVNPADEAERMLRDPATLIVAICAYLDEEYEKRGAS